MEECLPHGGWTHVQDWVHAADTPQHVAYAVFCECTVRTLPSSQVWVPSATRSTAPSGVMMPRCLQTCTR